MQEHPLDVGDNPFQSLCFIGKEREAMERKATYKVMTKSQVHSGLAQVPTDHPCLKAVMVFPTCRQLLMTQQWSKIEISFSPGGKHRSAHSIWTCRNSWSWQSRSPADPASRLTWPLETAYFEFKGSSSKHNFFIVPTNHLWRWLWDNIASD